MGRAAGSGAHRARDLPLTEGHSAGELIFDTTFFVVLVSTAVQGTP